jgi:lipopolysaccharide transport system permease protein
VAEVSDLAPVARVAELTVGADARPALEDGDAAAQSPAPVRLTNIVRRSTVVRRSFFGDIREIVRELWEFRDLVHQLTLRDIRVRYTQAVMGVGWALFAPMLIVLSGLLVRYAMAQASGRPVSLLAIGATALKAVPWSFFSGSLNLATVSLISNKTLITKLYFPRESIPMATVFAQTKDLAVAFGVLAVVLPFLGLTLSPNLLWAPLLLVLLVTYTLACAVFLSCANLFFRDVKYLVQLLLTFGIFLTPIFFEPQAFGPVGARIVMLNPLAPIIEGLRLSVIDGHNLLAPVVEVNKRGLAVLVWSPWYLAYSVLATVGGLLVSLRLFRRVTYIFAEYV